MPFSSQLDKVKDNQIIHRSTMERRSIYRSVRNEDPRYADSIVGSPDYMASYTPFQSILCLTSFHRLQKFYGENPIPTPSITGPSVVYCLSFLQGFPPSAVVHLRRHGPT